MSSAVGNKRKRGVSSNNNNCGNNLTGEILSSIATYLPKTSRALLAVSLMKNGEPSTASKAIILSVEDDSPYESLMDTLFSELDIEMNRPRNTPFSYRSYKAQLRNSRFWVGSSNEYMKNGLDQQMSQYYNGGWEILDFIDLPKDLAARLTDDDLAAILLCIDAKNNLKRLNLTHCFGIVGQEGLEPLRGSVVLEKLDLGLVRQIEIPVMFTDAQLTQEVVCEILNSILAVDGNEFRRLHVPWFGAFGIINPSERILQLIDSHDLAFMNEKNRCVYFGYDNLQGLLQLQNVENSSDIIDRCLQCNWHEGYVTCTGCNKIVCSGCEGVETCSGDGCNVVSCYSCRDRDRWPGARNIVNWCTSVYSELFNDQCPTRCGDCRLRECCNGTIDCKDCKMNVFDRLVEDNNEKQDEIDQLNVENEEMQAEIDQLRQELSQLRCE